MQETIQLINILLQSSPELKIILFFIIGLCVGSFLNVVIFRLPIILERQWHKNSAELLGVEYQKPDNYPDKFNLCTPSSMCLNCGHKVHLLLNIPVLGFVLAKGQCRYCNTRFSLQYPIVELITGLLFGLVVYLTTNWYLIFLQFIFISFVICAVTIDFKTFLLPDELTRPLLWLGLLANIHGLIAGSLARAVLGALSGFLLLWSINYIYKLATKKDGMGEGDFIFIAAILAWVGLDGFIPVLFFSPLLGIFYFIILYLFNRVKIHNPIPFGPFLGISGIIVLLFSQYFLKLYPL